MKVIQFAVVSKTLLHFLLVENLPVRSCTPTQKSNWAIKNFTNGKFHSISILLAQTSKQVKIGGILK